MGVDEQDRERVDSERDSIGAKERGRRQSKKTTNPGISPLSRKD